MNLRPATCRWLKAAAASSGLRRVFYEREARAFAAELVMPIAEVRRHWFALSAEGLSIEEIVR